MRKSLLLATLFASMAGAQVAPKQFPPEKVLDVARESALPNGRLFELGRLVVPICGEDVSWRAGTGNFFVLPQAIAVSLLSRYGSNADNHELGKNSTDEDSLIQIDRLTAMLLEPYGLAPLDFKRFLEQRESEASFFRLSYVRTRRVSPGRLEALVALHEHRRKEGRWLLPFPLEEEQFEALARHLAQAKEAGLISPLGSTRTTP